MIPLLMMAAAFAVQPIKLTHPRPIHGDLQQFPHIAVPTDAAQRRINQALDRLDAKARIAMRECFADSANPTSWQRQIETTMRGPDFLSYRVTDDVDCGGAYPNNSHSAIVYDLASGEPVVWTKLLPARLVGRQDLMTGPDGVRVVTLASSRLSALYMAGYDAALDPEDRSDCSGAPTIWGPSIPMIAWLDAAAGALALQFDFNHAMQVCSAMVIVSAKTLRREGASPRLLAALAAGAPVGSRKRRTAP